MDKRFLIAWIVIFVAWMGGSIAVHGGLLADGYEQLQEFFRSPEESEKYIHWVILAHIIMAGAFVWIYARGVNDSPWIGQGIRFGIAIACLGVIPTYMIYYVVQPMPGMFVVKQVVFDGLLVIILSVITAFLYKPKSA